MSGRPDGKAALITGTAGGQGRAAALLFAHPEDLLDGEAVRHWDGRPGHTSCGAAMRR
jgi:NAD(P)-dependent dehydrogenase (short-subunit alcohol dehydrogenase family)